MIASAISRLALGTAQFGMRYGVANRTGQVDRSHVAELLSLARTAGMDTLDTAISYGDSESILGLVGVQNWRVVSKLPALERLGHKVEDAVTVSVSQSLDRLRIPQLYGLLLHCPADLLGPDGDRLYSALLELKARKLVGRVGVSVYDPGELEQVLRRFQVDLVQAPYNVFDRRLESSGYLMKLAAAGIEVHVRSVFLQGLLLLDEEARPPYFNAWRTIWTLWRDWLAASGAPALDVCLNFALSRPQVSRIVVGIDNVRQLQEVLAAVGKTTALPPPEVSSIDVGLINPTNWPKP